MYMDWPAFCKSYCKISGPLRDPRKGRGTWLKLRKKRKINYKEVYSDEKKGYRANMRSINNYVQITNRM